MHTFSGSGFKPLSLLTTLCFLFSFSELDFVCGAALDLIRFTARDRRGICIGGGEGDKYIWWKIKRKNHKSQHCIGPMLFILGKLEQSCCRELTFSTLEKTNILETWCQSQLSDEPRWIKVWWDEEGEEKLMWAVITWLGQCNVLSRLHTWSLRCDTQCSPAQASDWSHVSLLWPLIGWQLGIIVTGTTEFTKTA